MSYTLLLLDYLIEIDEEIYSGMLKRNREFRKFMCFKGKLRRFKWNYKSTTN